MTHKVPMTAAGAKQLRDELEDLKTRARPQVITAIAEARAHGDLRENAEYHAAREQQGFIEGRISELEYKLAHAHVIDVTQLSPAGKVVFGATVQLMDEESGEEVRYQIVGEDEADIKRSLISVNSPIARALIGKEVGDLVEVQIPAGARSYEVLVVLYI